MANTITYHGVLRELGALAYSDRMRRIVELGRQSRTTLAEAELRARLEQGGFYERSLALYMCYGSGDGAHVLRALVDPSRGIRNLALQLVALACDDTQVAAALNMLHLKQQRKLLAMLAHRRRSGPIDAVLFTADETALPQLLPYGSPAVVAQLLPRAFASAGADDWRRLAARHLDLAVAALAERVAATSTFDQRLLWLANAVLPELAVRSPDQALALVRTLRPHVSLYQLKLQALAQRRPGELADLVIETGDKLQVDFSGLAHRLDQAQLQVLIERGHLTSPETWFPRLAPALRAAVYTPAALGWRDADGALPLVVVQALPAALRAAEARRHGVLPALITRPLSRLPFAACLPWDEAQAVLAPFVRNPDPALRVLALPALIGAARYQPERLPDALALVTARRNEQDPVRLAMLSALAGLPPSRWRPEHLPALGQSIRDALDAADCSHASAAAAERLVIALLPFQPDWSTAWLATLGRERGWLNSYALDQRLSEADVRRIAPALLPVLEAWQPRERDTAIFRAATMFGRRLAAFPALLLILERMTRDPRGAVASTALSLLARFQHTRLPPLIPMLVQNDPSWITQPIVYTYLHRHRQDLLTPFLGQTAFGGRFSTGKTRFVLPLLNGFERWTPEQQGIFATVLEQVTQDEQRDSPALFMVIKQLAALPAIPPRRILELADLGNLRVAAREAALRALGRLDAGQGIPTLLEALDDERARIAIYALRRSLLEMPAKKALELLQTVPLRKVTVAKEVVRLMGELPQAVAYQELLALAGGELHRDVRVALLRALWDHIEQPETWPVLADAAAAEDPAIAAGVIRIPADRRSPEALGHLAQLLASLLRHPEPKIRLDTLRRCASLPISDPARVLIEPLLAALGSPLPDERSAAAGAVFATYAGRDATLVGESIQRIRANRRGLLAATQSLGATLRWNRSRMLPTVHAVLTALADDPLTAGMQIDLAAKALLWDHLSQLVRQFATSGLLHAEAVATATHALAATAQQADLADLEAFEQAHATDPDERLRRIALAALVAQAQPPRGWDAERLRRLNQFRADHAPLVAAAAQFLFPPGEAEPG